MLGGVRTEEIAVMSTTLTNRFLTLGAVGALLFEAVLLIEGATRPGYNAFIYYGSELSLSSDGWQQIANFILGGMLILAGALGIHGAIGPSWGARLLVLFGLSLVSAGVFVTDVRPGGYLAGVDQPAAMSLHGLLHGLSGLVCFTSLAVAALLLARRFRGSIWGVYSLATGLVVLASFVSSTASSTLSETGVIPDSPTGLLQRVGIVAGWTWFAVLALQLRSE
jgi:hypothetical protein